MITAKKIRTLKPRTQLRKVSDVFHQAAREDLDEGYLREVLDVALLSEILGDDEKGRLEYFFSKRQRLSYDDISSFLLAFLGDSPADWDITGDDGKVDWDARTLLGHYLFLDHLRSPYNVGSVFRSAEAFGVSGIFIAPGTASPDHPRAKRTSRGAVDGVEWEEREIDALPGLPVFALELGGEAIDSFRFPERGICLIGSEETGLSKEGRDTALSSLGLVSIPQLGAKGSLNVSAATAILLYEWMKASSSPASTCKGS